MILTRNCNRNRKFISSFFCFAILRENLKQFSHKQHFAYVLAPGLRLNTAKDDVGVFVKHFVTVGRSGGDFEGCEGRKAA